MQRFRSSHLVPGILASTAGLALADPPASSLPDLHPLSFADEFLVQFSNPDGSQVDPAEWAPVSQNNSFARFPYSEPQETGNRTSTRWFALTNARGRGLGFVADPARSSVPEQVLGFSALRHSVEEMDVARYHYELVEDDRTHLLVDGAQSGVGGDNSWGALAKPDRRLSGSADHRFAFLLFAINGPDEPAERWTRRPLP